MRQKDGHNFRPSALKKDPTVQPLPINFHAQLFCVRGHGSQSGNACKPVVCDSLTSGCISPFALGFKKGGLESLENALLVQKKRLEELKIKFFVATSSSLTISALNQGLERPCFYPNSHEAALLKDVSQLHASFEMDCLTLALRRLLCLSQALTILINGVLIKLSLVVEGYIAQSQAEQWSKGGILFLFEGLLSVTGNERCMLEDTAGALELVRQYEFCILSYAQALTLSATFNDPGYTNRSNSEISSVPWTQGDMAEFSEAQKDQGPKVFMQGRRFYLVIPDDSHSQLPACYQEKPIFLAVIPVLFSQGVDIQQTMANATNSTSNTYTGIVTRIADKTGLGGEKKTADGLPSNTGELQSQINRRGLWLLDRFCRDILPDGGHLPGSIPRKAGSKDTMPSSGAEVHSLLRELDDNIRWSTQAKNVEMLQAAERVCVLLGGMRVTFCKSGKDRTGMVVTLEQSRQLGERFHCGTDQARLLRDATIMRTHGTRIEICAKNIGRRVYSINKLQAQFLPLLLRPPPSLLEDLFKQDLS